MAVSTVTNIAYALKTKYSPKKVQILAYKKSPFFALVPKAEGFTGNNFAFSVQHGLPVGRSQDFTTAQANKAVAAGKQFVITRVHDYALVSLTTEAILASRDNEGAFADMLKNSFERAVDAVAKSISIGLYGDGTGSIGVVGTLSTATVTLTNASDIVNYETGQVLIAAENAASAPRDSGTGYTILSVDRDLGKFTLSATPQNSAFTAGDLIFSKGDYISASDRNMIAGLRAWIPTVAPASTAFFGVDRTSDVGRLAGHRVDGAGLRIDEALNKLIARVNREGGDASHVFLPWEKWEELTNILESKRMVPINVGNDKLGKVGFTALEFISKGGPIMVVPDAFCPAATAYVLTLDSWEFRTLGPAPQVIDLDGGKLDREYNADGFEMRVGFWGNLLCYRPNENGVAFNI